MKKAQDNIRENLQKQRFGLLGEHTRDDKYDSFYKIPIEFKTKAQDKGCTTKRRYSNDPFADCVLVVTDYVDKNTLSNTDWIVFPEALEEWRTEQERKLSIVKLVISLSKTELSSEAKLVKCFTDLFEHGF